MSNRDQIELFGAVECDRLCPECDERGDDCLCGLIDEELELMPITAQQLYVQDEADHDAACQQHADWYYAQLNEQRGLPAVLP